MANKRILVIGGTGYIGKALVKKLLNSYDVTLLVKNKKKNINCKFFIGDLLNKKNLVNNISNFDMIINLASVVRSFNKKRYRENVIGLKNLVEAMKIKDVKKIIYFSSQNVNLKHNGYYSRSKKAAERLLIDSGIEHMIIRPNYVYGIDKENDFYRMMKIMSITRIAPILGKGKFKIQPVLKDDLINIITTFVSNFKDKEIVEISGEDTVSISNIINMLQKKLGIHVLRIHIPISLLKIFKSFIPFEIEGFEEDNTAKIPYRKYSFSSLNDNLNKIIQLKTS